MPFKSEAQRKYMNYAAQQGKIKKSVVEEFNKASEGMELPDRIGPVGNKKHMTKHAYQVDHRKMRGE